MATHFKGSKEDVLVLDTYIKLLRASDSVTSRLNLNLQTEGLTTSQFSILEALYHLGPLCQSDLGKKIFKSGGNITHVVDNLEKLGFVTRERKNDDRRYFNIHLTDQGRSQIEQVFSKHLELIKKEFLILNEDEMIELQRLCKKLGKKE